MDWISLLKAQQVDFLRRIKKPKINNLYLLDSQVKGCHAEVMELGSESLTELCEVARQQAEIIARNPPPIPPDYPDSPDWAIPFEEYFQQQAQDYLVREQIVEQVISQRLGKLIKKVSQDTLKNMVLDDEGNLLTESKFPYFLNGNSSYGVQVYVTDGTSFNGIKKDKIRWSVTQEDIKNNQLLIFLCLFNPLVSKVSYNKKVVIAGFLPTNLIELGDPKLLIAPSNLLYVGGLHWYLESLKKPKDIPRAQTNDVVTLENIQALPSGHDCKNIIGDWECWQTLRGHTRGINCLVYVPQCKNNGNLPILASGSRGEIKLWDFTKGELISTLSEYPWTVSGLVDEVKTLAFNHNGQLLVSGGADSTIKIWHVGARDLIDILHKHNGIVRCVAFTPDTKMLVTGGDDRKILFWDLVDRLVVATLSLDDNAAHALAISPASTLSPEGNGKVLVTGSYRKIKVWRINYEGKENLDIPLLYSFTAHSHIVTSLTISADGKYLISGSRDRTIKIWNLETAELLHTLKGHRDGVDTIALSADGKMIASGSADNTIKIWHLETGQLLATFSGHSSAVSALLFTPSGDKLISGSLDQTIKIWQRN